MGMKKIGGRLLVGTWKVLGKCVESWRVWAWKVRGYGRGKCLESCGGMWAWKVRGKCVLSAWKVVGCGRGKCAESWRV